MDNAYADRAHRLRQHIAHTSDPVSCPHCGTTRGVWDMVIHLNDSARWSREDIAAWLDGLGLDLTVRPDVVHPSYAGGGPFHSTINELEAIVADSKHIDRVQVSGVGNPAQPIGDYLMRVTLTDGEVVIRTVSTLGKLAAVLLAIDMVAGFKEGVTSVAAKLTTPSSVKHTAHNN